MTITLEDRNAKAREAFKDLMKILTPITNLLYARYYNEDEFVFFELNVFDGGLSLGLIKTPDGMRKKGLGTRALKELCLIADKHQIKIFGSVTPVTSKYEGKGMTKAQLHKWYAKFGFTRETYICDPKKLSDNIIREPLCQKNS